MKIRTLRFITLLLAALAMGMHLAHAFELFPKLQWAPELYIAVQTSLYTVFGTIGPILEVGALIFSGILAFQLRQRRPAFQLTLVGFGVILLSLIIWGVVVMPANVHINEWAATGIAPSDWERWRTQWQGAQATIFLFHLTGFSALLFSVIRETTED